MVTLSKLSIISNPRFPCRGKMNKNTTFPLQRILDLRWHLVFTLAWNAQWTSVIIGRHTGIIDTVSLNEERGFKKARSTPVIREGRWHLPECRIRPQEFLCRLSKGWRLSSVQKCVPFSTSFPFFPWLATCRLFPHNHSWNLNSLPYWTLQFCFLCKIFLPLVFFFFFLSCLHSLISSIGCFQSVSKVSWDL